MTPGGRLASPECSGAQGLHCLEQVVTLYPAILILFTCLGARVNSDATVQDVMKQPWDPRMLRYFLMPLILM